MKHWIPVLMMFVGVSSVSAAIHAPVSVVAPRTSARPGIAPRSTAVANLISSVRQKAAASAAAAANKSGKKTSPSGLLIFNPGDSAEVALLRKVYSLLALADHDYKGHRRHAMHDVAAAAKLLGGHLHGDGKAGEKQAVSDGQLRDAQGMLSRAGSSPVARAIKGVGAHIHSAISQLGVALKIK